MLISLPYFIVKAIFSRPHPGWTFKQTLLVHCIREYLHILGLAGVPDSLSLEPGNQGERFQVIDPTSFPRSIFQGPALSPIVSPEKIGGTWYPRKPDNPKGPIVLWNHGGAFVTGHSRELFCGFLAEGLLERAGAEAVFCLEYRLSGYGKNPFPAAFQDMITAYSYLTETLKIPPASIVVGGDSAGANLTIAFLRYLEEHSTGIKPPGSAVLCSPWVSPLESLSPTCSYREHKTWATDYLTMSFLQFGARTYASGDLPAEYITPQGHPFRTGVPLFASFGECEILGPGVIAWAEEMRTVRGNEVQLYCEKDAPHDTVSELHLQILEFSKVGWRRHVIRREFSTCFLRLLTLVRR